MPNTTRVMARLQKLAAFPAIDGCALVEVSTGMAWHVAGNHPELERVGEAAIEFWRVQTRLSEHLAVLGPLKSAAYSFANRVVALFPCSDDPALVLVCVAAKGPVAWADWGVEVEALRGELANSPISQISPKSASTQLKTQT